MTNEDMGLFEASLEIFKVTTLFLLRNGILDVEGDNGARPEFNGFLELVKYRDNGLGL